MEQGSVPILQVRYVRIQNEFKSHGLGYRWERQASPKTS
jgi:hypothetical protein